MKDLKFTVETPDGVTQIFIVQNRKLYLSWVKSEAMRRAKIDLEEYPAYQLVDAAGKPVNEYASLWGTKVNTKLFLVKK